jgi:hypothetical protein
MELAWWEAAALFLLWAIQFALSPVPLSAPFWGAVAGRIHRYVTYTYLIWSGVEIVRLLLGRRKPLAFTLFVDMWRRHVQR